jgi:hypothetical protein
MVRKHLIIHHTFYLYLISIFFTEKDPLLVKTVNQYYTIENLEKYSNYTFWVLAYTKVGDGATTNQFYCATHEDGKFESLRTCSLIDELVS